MLEMWIAIQNMNGANPLENSPYVITTGGHSLSEDVRLMKELRELSES